MKEDKARYYMRFDEELNVLVVEVTSNVAFGVIKMIRTHLWPEVEHMKSEKITVVDDDGYEYKDVTRYVIPAYKDRVEILFDAAKSAVVNGIKKSISNSDN